ncbi:AbrB/MazE/SpoVT family DNA-binding domain-containing protein [Candidatus Woesearchaeota archaeon]|nr:AbrB/MazE/SpoVT family DNA-binding domain-containing protein [Candidatus Woesearchaeota archaeon]
MKCVFCKAETREQEVEYKEYGISLGTFPGFVCTKCGEVFFEGEVVDKIQQKSKEKGLFGLSRKVKVGKIGDSLMVRIPKEIANFVKLKEGKEVRITPEAKKIIIEN